MDSREHACVAITVHWCVGMKVFLVVAAWDSVAVVSVLGFVEAKVSSFELVMEREINDGI